MEAKTLYVRVGKNKFGVRAIPLNRTATWAVERLVDRAHKLGATDPEHYLIPRRIAGKQHDPTNRRAAGRGERRGSRLHKDK